MNPLLSIIIPIYNSEDYLPGCLDGILAASLSNAELLLIDDGSTDASLRICRSYEEKYPFIQVLSQANSGPAAVRNRGMDESRGEYIAVLDADDRIDPDAFRRTVQLMKAYYAQVWISDFHRIAANGCVLDKVYQIEETERPITDPAYMEDFLSDGERVWNVWRYIFQRDFLLENGLRFIEGVNCAEAVEFVVRALTLAKRPAFFHNPYYYYRAHYGDTLTRQYTVRRVEQLMQMLCLSAEHLHPLDTACSRLLTDKLVKEYLLNLALCCEVPGQERENAFAACAEAKPLLRLAGSGKLRLISALVSALGIRLSAWLLYGMKNIKRRIRRRKIKHYGRRAEGQQKHET